MAAEFRSGWYRWTLRRGRWHWCDNNPRKNWQRTICGATTMLWGSTLPAYKGLSYSERMPARGKRATELTCKHCIRMLG